MAQGVILPKEGLTMEEGTILDWIVKEGGTVTKGEPLFSMETDKLTITIDAVVDGTLLKILHKEGDCVPVATLIAVVGQPGEDISGFTGEGAPAVEAPKADEAVAEAPKAEAAPVTAASADGKVYASPRAKMRAEEKGIDIASVPGSGPDGFVIERDILASKSVSATSVAKRVAKNENVDLASVTGTGFGGKITSDDVYAAKKADAPVAEAPKADVPTAAAPAVSGRGDEVVKISGVRKIISRRMHESLSDLAQANHRINVDMTEATRVRNQLKANSIKISFNDIIIKCVAKALMEYPEMNCCMDEKEMTIHHYVNMGMAVDTPRGLLVPVIKDADLLTLPQIAAESARVAGLTKEGKIGHEDMSGATFTISNLGMFGIDDFTAIINKPEAGIIAVGRIADTCVPVNGQIEIRPIMQMSLTYDHRVVDGAPAARFLKRVKDLLESPAMLL